MRLLEILLIMAHALWLTSFTSTYLKRQKTYIASFSILLFILHPLLEGYRWQMFCTYMLTLILSILTIRSRRSANKPHLLVRQTKHKTFTLSILICFYSVTSIGLLVLMPVIELPKPTGIYEVGMTSIHLTDKTREEPFSQKLEYREIMAQVWYPAEMTDENETIIYESFPHEEWAGTMEFIFQVPSFFFNYLQYGKTHSIKNAKVSNDLEQYPVLLFSHGFGSTRMQNFSQMEELASHGYIVISIDHSYDAGFTKLPNHTVIRNNQDSYAYSFDLNDGTDVQTRSLDMNFVLDKMGEINSNDPAKLFTGKIDLNRVGIFGHSYGGSTAAQTLANDSRFKAGLNIDGPLHEPVASTGFEQPFMFMINENYLYLTEEEVKKTNITLEEYQQYHEKISKLLTYHFEEGTKGDTYLLTFHKGDHYSFTDFPYLSPLLALQFDVKEFHKTMNQYVLAFFDQYVKGNDTTLLPDKNTTVQNELFSLKVNRK